MKTSIYSLLVCMLLGAVWCNEAEADNARIIENYGKIPLAFTLNQGQLDSKVRFTTNGNGCSMFFSPTETTFLLSRETEQSVAKRIAKRSVVYQDDSFADHESEITMEHFALMLQFINAKLNPDVVGEDRLPWNNNYLIGNNHGKWKTDVPNYKKVRLKNIYDGIDLVYYGNKNRIKYDFVVQPGKDLAHILLSYNFGDSESGSLSINDKGELVVSTPLGDIIERKPYCYQKIDGKEVEIEIQYKITNNNLNQFTFNVDSYYPDYSLIIDPELAYSTFLGGINLDWGRGIAVDESGNAYVTGITQSTDFPSTLGSYEENFNSESSNGDVFVVKLNSTGSELIYSTFIGGSSAEIGYGIDLDNNGNAYITGDTNSFDFPATSGSFGDTSFSNGHIFVLKLNANGNDLVYSVNMNMGDGRGIKTDSDGNVYVTGNGINTESGDAGVIVFKLNPLGNELGFLKIIGAGRGQGITLDKNKNIYITGYTQSPDFYTTPGAYDESYNGGNEDVIIVKLNQFGEIIYSTFLGGNKTEWGYGIAINGEGNAYVTGGTASQDFPITSGASDKELIEGDAFLTKINTTGSDLEYSTFFGGTRDDQAYGICLDNYDNAYVTGSTISSDFPTTPDAYKRDGGGVFISKINTLSNNFEYSTLLGSGNGHGIYLDIFGDLYITGLTDSPDFPTTSGAYDESYNYRNEQSLYYDVFVTKFKIETIEPIITVNTPNGGEEWIAETTHEITWKSKNVDEVKLDYSTDGGSTWKLIANTNALAGSFLWTSPNTPSENCLVKISNAADSSVFDQSNEIFTVTPLLPIMVISPNGGERWLPGSTQNITWKQTTVSRAIIEYSTDNGLTWSLISSSTDASVGSYDWSIPDTEYFNCVVRITDIDNVNQMDVSDNTFNISRLKWIFQTDGEIYSPPAIGDDGSIYTISYEGETNSNLYALNPAGTLKWKYSLGSCFTVLNTPVISDDGTIYAGIFQNRYDYGSFYAINPDGTLKWEYETVTGGTTTPAIGNDGTFYVHIDSLYAINPDGSLKWKAKPSGIFITGSLSIGGNNTIYGRLNAIYPDGVLDWQYKTDHEVFSPTIDSDGTLYSGSSDTNYNKYIYAVNPDGTLKWKYETEYAVHSPTIGVDGTLYAGTTYSNTDKYLYALNPDGTLKWKYVSDGIFYSTTISSDGTIYISTYYSLHAINPDGSLKWKYSTESSIHNSPPVIANNGTIYLGTLNGNLLAIDSGTNAELADSPWPKMYHDLHNTSRTQYTIDPILKLFSPNGGEAWEEGSSQTISWYSSFEVKNVKIEYSHDGETTWNLITPNIIASNKSHTWIVPDVNSSYYKIRVTDIQENTRYDESDDTFTLFSEPFIKVISPNGGEMWKVGSTQNIVWDYYGLINVTIEYSIDNGDTWKTLISNASASDKNYGFTVPSGLSSDCKIKIIDDSLSTRFDESDETFSIEKLEILTTVLLDAIAGFEYADTIIVDYSEMDKNVIIEIVAGPEWLSINNEGALSGTPELNDAGTGIPVSIRVVNESGIADTLSTSINVLKVPPIEAKIAFDHVFQNAGYQGGGSVINNPGPGERFGFAVYLKNNTVISGFTIDLQWDSTKASFRTSQSNPVISDDIYDINGQPSVEFAEETNILLSDDTGSLSSIVGAEEEGRFKVSWAKMGGESITIPEGLLYLAVFKTADDFSEDDWLTISVDVTVSDDKGNEYPLQGKVFNVGSEIAPPSNVTVTDIPGDQGHSMEITWTLSPDDAAISHYNIYRSRFPDFTDPIALESFVTLDELISAEQNSTILIESVQRGETTYLDVTVPVSNVEYYYWLQAISENGASEKVSARNIITSVESIPTGLRLNVPYPNPFNPTTTIEYYLSQDTYVILEIYNVSGQKVAVLKDGIAEIGYHSIVWNALGMPSGIYFCRLTTDDFIDMKKMLLLK